MSIRLLFSKTHQNFLILFYTGYITRVRVIFKKYNLCHVTSLLWPPSLIVKAKILPVARRFLRPALHLLTSLMSCSAILSLTQLTISYLTVPQPCQAHSCLRNFALAIPCLNVLPLSICITSPFSSLLKVTFFVRPSLTTLFKIGTFVSFPNFLPCFYIIFNRNIEFILFVCLFVWSISLY